MSDTTAKAPGARLHALIPCAGSGSRSGAAGPKQYQPLAGQALVLHTLAAFAAVPAIDTLLVCVAPGDRTLADQPGIVLAECGGPTRAATVANGLRVLRERGAHEADWVLVHDAARCLITPVLVQRLVDACRDDPVGGLLAQPVADTLKRANAANAANGDPRAVATVPREGLWQAQTPQMFRLGLLDRALAEAGDVVTDEASAIEGLSLHPRLVAGSALNFKVTWPDDFALAEALLLSRQGKPSS